MVGGAVFCNPYSTGQALIAWSLSNWHYFDGWATASGIDLLKVSCPRYLNLILHYLTKDTDAEGRETFEKLLEEVESEAEYNKKPVPAKTETEDKDKLIIPVNNPWKAPPGWRPPGWISDEENIANIQALMGPQIIGNKTIPK